MKENDKKHANLIKYDRQATKALLLETAGEVFAKRGYAMATSKEICELAGVNSASVNYYFGGKENLYKEVLIEAHKKIISLDDLAVLLNSSKSEKDKLKDFFMHILGLASNAKKDWSLKLILAEGTHASDLGAKAIEEAVLTKKDIFLLLLHKTTALPIDSEEIQSALLLIISTCVGIISSASLADKMKYSSAIFNKDRYVDDLVAYTLGGLFALKKEYEEKAKKI